MGFLKRYDTSPSANKRQFSPTFRKPGGKNSEKRAFFGSFLRIFHLRRRMRKYKLCTPLEASCQGASFATLLGCLVGHRAEKTSKNLLKKRVGHFVRSKYAVKIDFAARDPTPYLGNCRPDYPALAVFNFDPPIFPAIGSKSKIIFDRIDRIN